jgi:hypothetical protein
VIASPHGAPFHELLDDPQQWAKSLPHGVDGFQQGLDGLRQLLESLVQEHVGTQQWDECQVQGVLGVHQRAVDPLEDPVRGLTTSSLWKELSQGPREGFEDLLQAALGILHGLRGIRPQLIASRLKVAVDLRHEWLGLVQDLAGLLLLLAGLLDKPVQCLIDIVRWLRTGCHGKLLNRRTSE